MFANGQAPRMPGRIVLNTSKKSFFPIGAHRALTAGRTHSLTANLFDINMQIAALDTQTAAAMSA